MTGGLGSVFSFLLSLVFIIILAVVSIRLLGRKTGFGSNQRIVRVTTVVPLGTNKSLQVVVIGKNRVLLIGVGSHVEPLASFEDEELAAELLQSTAHTLIPNGSSWLDRLAVLRKLQPVKRTKHETSEWATVQDRLEMLRHRRSDLFRDSNKEDQEPLDDSSFEEILLDLARRQK